MIKIYGSRLCPDCVACCDDLDQAGIAYEYLDFSEDLANLKAFLALRDREAVFASAREAGKIGIPAILPEDGSVHLDWAFLL